MRSLAVCLLLVTGCAQYQPPDVARLEDQRVEASEPLIEALERGDAATRARAARAMGRIQSPAYAPALAAATRDGDREVRREALFALGQLGLARGAAPPPVAVEAARAALSARDQELAPLAAEALGKLAPDGAAETLVPLLEADSAALRAAAVDALFRLRFVPVWRGRAAEPPELSAAATRAVARALADPEVEVRRAAAHLFSRYGGPDAIDELTRAIEDSDEWVRLWSLRALGRSEEAEPPSLYPGFGDVSARVRAETVLAANRLRAPQLVPLPLAADPSWHVRRAVAEALAGRSDERELETLRQLARDDSPSVRQAAVVALAARLGERFADQLAALAEDEDWRMRLIAAPAASGLGEKGRPILERLAADDDRRVVVAALEQLAALGDPERIERALTADDLAVRGTAVQLVPRAGLADPVASLERALDNARGDEWIEIREGIVDALVELEAGSELLLRLAAEDPAPSVRARARTALERAGVEVAAVSAPPIAPSDLLGAAPAGVPRVVVETSKGDLVLRLFPAEAPIHVANFLELVDSGFYDGLLWHRVVTNFVVQGGDPRGDGWGGGGRTLRDEINPIRFARGTVGMPKAGKDTGGSQLFITHVPTPHLDGNYTVFAQVEDGLEVIDELEVGDRIEEARRLESQNE